jgi:hypothetical protein
MTKAEWLACTDPTPVLELLRGKASERRLRLFNVVCCRRVWDRLVNERSRRAVEIIEQHIEGQATDEQMQSAEAEAEQAYRSLKEQVLASFVGSELAHRASQMPRGLFDLTNRQTALDAHNAADDDPIALTASAVWTATSLAADFVEAGYSLLDSAINTANQASDPAPNPQAEKAAQAGILRDIFGNPLRPIALAPAWRTPTVAGLAQTAYDNRLLPAGTLDTDRLAILADALEEAGCTNADMLNHLRGPGPHVLGCWAVDLILGKE